MDELDFDETMRVTVTAPDDWMRNHRIALRVEHWNDLCGADLWELSYSSPDSIGWCRVDYWYGNRHEPPSADVEPVEFKTVLACEALTPAQRDQILDATLATIRLLLEAYMAHDEAVFEPTAQPYIDETAWDEAARQIERLRREWREVMRLD